MAINLPKILTDQPSFLFQRFTGYTHFQDATLVRSTDLTYPSRNGSIPMFDKFVPDKGKTLLGQAFTELVGINGHAQKFKNMGGLEMEVRTWPSANVALGDVVEILYNGNWLPITENPNPLPRGVHEVYFEEWFDTKLLSTVAGSPPSKNVPRLVWVNGISRVFTWTGGVVPINSLTATNFLLPPGITWASYGFTTDATGTAYVVVNQTVYTLVNPADLNTNSINVTSTAGAIAGDIATSRIEADIAPIDFDMCRNNKGYMFYGNWTQRDLYMSNAFNRDFDYKIVAFQALNNDLIVSPSFTSPYTGTIEELFHVVIDSVQPDVEIQTYTSTGLSGLDDARFVTSAYSGTAGALNVYKVVTVADFTILVTTAGGSYTPGEVVQGATSNAEGIFIGFVVNGANDQMAIKMISTNASFVTGEQIVGQDSTTSKASISVAYQDWVQYYKNDVLTAATSGPVTGTLVPLFNAPPDTVTLTDGLTIVFGNFYGHAVGDTFQLDIRTGGVDTFSWQVNQGPITTGVPITGALQTLQDGVQIMFNNVNGHQIGDYWDILATPNVSRAFNNFYYAVPIRRPGEGYKFRLSSNFWTMDTQEDSMYVNQSYGEWAYVTTELSADLQSESVLLTPLKQAGALKVIFPYMTSHINDQLIFVSIDKKLQTLGREQFLEKPQSGYLSEAVNLDFLSSSFLGGSIKYLDKQIFISSPVEGVTHNYDTHQKYWNPPKSFAEVGIMSIVGNTLICHSQTRNQSYTMFTSTAGDDGQSYTVEMRTAMYDVGDRWDSKSSSMSFTEGYIEGAPTLIHTVYLGVDGCGGIFPHTIEPIVCIRPDFAPFGQGSFGTHPFGNDVGIVGSYFQEIWKRYTLSSYYFISIGIECSAKNHSWSILATGMNGIYSIHGNNPLVAPSNKVI